MIGLFIGRFQPLHNGHVFYINKILSECQNLVIIIGSSQEKRTDKNPFSVEERKTMLSLRFQNELKLKKIKLISAVDYPDDNEKWLLQIKKKAGKFDTVYAGQNKLVREIFQDSGFKVKAFPRIENLSGTKIRKLMHEKKDWKKHVPQAVYSYLAKKNIFV